CRRHRHKDLPAQLANVRRSARCLPPSVSVSRPGTTLSFHRPIAILFNLAYPSLHSLINTPLRLSDVPREPEPGHTGRPKGLSGLSHRPTDDRPTPSLKSPELSSRSFFLPYHAPHPSWRTLRTTTSQGVKVGIRSAPCLRPSRGSRASITCAWSPTHTGRLTPPNKAQS